MSPKVIERDGVHLPEGLRKLPAGQDAVEPLTEPLSNEEEVGISEGLNKLDAGHGIALAELFRR